MPDTQVNTQISHPPLHPLPFTYTPQDPEAIPTLKDFENTRDINILRHKTFFQLITSKYLKSSPSYISGKFPLDFLSNINKAQRIVETLNKLNTYNTQLYSKYVTVLQQLAQGISNLQLEQPNRALPKPNNYLFQNALTTLTAAFRLYKNRLLVRGPYLYFLVPEYSIQGIALGPFIIQFAFLESLTAPNYRLKVYIPDPKNVSVNGGVFPNIASIYENSSVAPLQQVCWGDFKGSGLSCFTAGNFLMFFDLLDAYFHTYNPNDHYFSLSTWHIPTGDHSRHGVNNLEYSPLHTYLTPPRGYKLPPVTSNFTEYHDDHTTLTLNWKLINKIFGGILYFVSHIQFPPPDFSSTLPFLILLPHCWQEPIKLSRWYNILFPAAWNPDLQRPSTRIPFPASTPLTPTSTTPLLNLNLQSTPRNLLNVPEFVTLTHINDIPF